MKVLIGFEESGIAREAFKNLGHKAYSCDILPTRIKSRHHIQADIYEALYFKKWDIVILHPECTKLCVSGNSTYSKYGPKYKLRLKAIRYTEKLWFDAIEVCDKVCLENPVGVLSTKSKLPKFQYIQPWQFGHTEQKKTGLCLHNLPPLVPTKDVYEEMMLLPKRERERNHYMSQSLTRARDRSETYPGIAKAFAKQWGR